MVYTASTFTAQILKDGVFEKAIEQRHLNAVHFALWLGRSNPRWPAIAKLMNLPAEKAI